MEEEEEQDMVVVVVDYSGMELVQPLHPILAGVQLLLAVVELIMEALEEEVTVDGMAVVVAVVVTLVVVVAGRGRQGVTQAAVVVVHLRYLQ